MSLIKVEGSKISNWSLDFSQGNMQYKHIKNFQIEESKSNISFRRTDFRGSKIENCNFKNLDFSNSDFIDSVIIGCKFENCNFSDSSWTNSIFIESELINNDFTSIGIGNTNFNKCRVENCNLNSSTLKQIVFDNSVVFQNSFKVSSIDEIKFLNCQLTSIDLSNSTSLNLFFEDCKFNKCSIDIDYLSSYLFVNCSPKKFKHFYRGTMLSSEIKIKELVCNFIEYLKNKNRYFELMNVSLLYRCFFENEFDIHDIVKTAFSLMLHEKNDVLFTHNVKFFSLMIEFYQFSTIIRFDECILIIAQLEKTVNRRSNMRAVGYLVALKRIFESKILDLKGNVSWLSPSDTDTFATVKLTYNLNDKKNAIKDTKKAIDFFLKTSYEKNYSKEIIKIIDVRKGSVEITLLTFVSTAYLLMRFLKLTVDMYGEIYTSILYYNKVGRFLSNSISAKDVFQIRAVAKSLTTKNGSELILEDNFLEKLKGIEIKVEDLDKIGNQI